MGVCVEFAGTLRSMWVTVTYHIYVITHCHAFESDEVQGIIFLAIGTKADVGQTREAVVHSISSDDLTYLRDNLRDSAKTGKKNNIIAHCIQIEMEKGCGPVKLKG